MNVFRGCATIQLLMFFGFVTSCVVGVRHSLNEMNPTHFSRTVDEAPDATRRRVRDVFEPAVSEDGMPLVPDGPPAAIKVQDFSDGTVHLTVAQTGRPLLEVVARVLPRDSDDRATVEIVSDAERLAAALKDGPGKEEIHRRIRRVLDQALDDIDDGRVVETGLLVSRLIRDTARPRMRRRRYEG